MVRRTVSGGLDEGLILGVGHGVLANVEFGEVDGVGREFVIVGVLVPGHDAAHLEFASRDADEKEGDGAGDGEDLGGRWGWLGLGKLGFDEAGVLARVVLLEFGEEIGDEEEVLTVVDEFVGHVFNAVTRAEAPNDQPEVGAVLAEAAEILRGEGGEEELADGGYVVLLGVVAHGLAPVSGTE
jgi:hypothetical protein